MKARVSHRSIFLPNALLSSEDLAALGVCPTKELNFNSARHRIRRRQEGKKAVTQKLTLIPKTHPADEVFESYAFGRLSGRETADLEEHVLICEMCQSKLAQTDDYVRLMKAATLAYVTEHPGSVPHSRQLLF